MRTNANITIYNKFFNSTSQEEEYYRTPVSKVMWENRKARSVLAAGGNIAVDQASIFIPLVRDADFLSSIAWTALVDKSTKWTLKRGDILVKGIVDDELSTSFTPTQLKAKYDDVLEISSVDFMDMGSRSLQHWKIGAK